ncbi:MAG TPA: hypothetical protein VD866_26065 [Urbifossiella sp.]|nr:hypothetical protein [Urbifossiella sp.]
MTTTEQADLFAALTELARRYPHWRVGQLVANVAGWADADVWDAEDEQLLAAARAHLGTEVGPAQAAQSAGGVCSLPGMPSPLGR